MVRPVLYLYLFAKWYLYLYFWYFCVIFLCSAFHVKLGCSMRFVKFMDGIFRYVNKCRNLSPIEDAEEKLEAKTKSPDNITGNDICDKLYSATVLQNGEIPKFSSTIKRELILIPEFQSNLYNRLVNDTEDDEIDFSTSTENVYELADITMYVRAGIEAIIEDQITSRFEAEQLESWNLLSRNNPHLRFYNAKIALFWFLGLLFRYLILLPVRLLNCITALSLLMASMTIISYVPDSKIKKKIFYHVHIGCFFILARWLGIVRRFHNPENKPKNGIAVSNHTTPFDVVTLSTDNSYALTGQKHGGMIGYLEKIVSKASPHIWFDRASIADRELVARKLRVHVHDKENPPILIFPEGTCINNTAVTQFKKGAFEVGATVYPVAIKYDARYGDAFWNSSKQTASQHVLQMMTSWSIVADIWYLTPVTQNPNETSVQFSNRVKSIIAKQINIIDLAWDGQVKRIKPKPEWKELHKKLFYEKLKSRLRCASA